MRVMILLKGDPDHASGEAPSEELLAAMGRFNEELVDAGVMIGGEGLHHSSKGKRVRFAKGEEPLVIDGPFVETKEILAGYWLWKVSSMEEAIEWVRRIPDPGVGADGATEIEIRPVYEAEDFGEAFTPELREQEERLRERLAAQQ